MPLQLASQFTLVNKETNVNKFLLSIIFVLSLIYGVQAHSINHECLDKDDNFIACPVPGKPIGWIKTSDISCELTQCHPIGHYTDVQKKGQMCATYGIPVYDRPGGKPIGLLWNETMIVEGEQKEGYTFIYGIAGDEIIMTPYSVQSLKACG